MGKVKDEQLFTLLRDFLLVYLPNQRKASSNTVKAYRTTLNQFLKYTAGQKNIPVLSVTSGMVTYEMVNSYLDWLSAEKNAAPATRNNRLAAIRAFISYATACRPEYISIASGLAAIGIQKNDRFAKVDYMTEEAVKTLLAEPDTRTEIGVRDQFLMIFLYDTGARIQEVLDVKICDIKVDRTPTVMLHGKGKKTRIVPLMKDTVKHLQNYMKVFHPARLRIQKYAASAREKCPDVPLNVHPHLWRHTRAMHLYQHGMDLTLISQWLGHKQLETTLI